MKTNIENAQVTVLLEIDDKIHLIGMKKEHFKAVTTLVKLSAKIAIPTNRTQQDLNEFLGYTRLRGENMAVDIQDPRITRTLRTGYPKPIKDEPYGDDFFGNEVMPGDEILIYEDEFFRKEDISYDLQKFLLHLGAAEKIAN